LHIILKRKTQILFFSFATFCTVAIGTFVITPSNEPKAHILVNVVRESRNVPAIAYDIPVISSNHDAQINSEIEILKARSLIQDVVTALGPATICPDIDPKKKKIPAAVIAGRSRQDKTPAEKALRVLQKKLEVQGIKKFTNLKLGFLLNWNVPFLHVLHEGPGLSTGL
jgi:uncharacterized protein involved in exopolysaccharide biosynthesis